MLPKKPPGDCVDCQHVQFYALAPYCAHPDLKAWYDEKYSPSRYRDSLTMRYAAMARGKGDFCGGAKFEEKE